MIECICIDSKNKPKEIPLGKWIQEGFKYHITYIQYYPNQGIQGCTLYEISLKGCFPYTAFSLSRFAVTKENLALLMEMIKDCHELNNLDVLELIKESELVLVD